MEVQMKYGALEKSDTMVPFGSIGYVNMLQEHLNMIDACSLSTCNRVRSRRSGLDTSRYHLDEGSLSRATRA